jgi:RNA polymerase sigma factor for flagellar operon FliA
MPLTDPGFGSDEERSLWTAFKNDGSTQARERLFEQYAGFATSIASRQTHEHIGGDVEFGDLRQLAYAGLLEALDRFDPTRGIPFRGFAAHRITGSIRDGVRRTSELREQISWRRRVRQDRLRSLAGDPSGDISLSEAMAELADIAVGLALGFMLEDTGFINTEEPASSSPRRPTGYDSLTWKELVGRLQTELTRLPQREQTILHQHYLNGVAFDQLASLLAVSKGRVSQLHRNALVQLRKRLGAKGHLRLEG